MTSNSPKAVDPPGSQYLFTYGTLQSGHPEHLEHAPISLSRTVARVAGSLYQLKEGYPILVVPRWSVVCVATHDWLCDWAEALEGIGSFEKGFAHSATPLVKGELIEVSLQPDALSKPDRWEGFEIGRSSVYQRSIVPAVREDGAILPAWAYTCTEAPLSATEIPSGVWTRPENLK